MARQSNNELYQMPGFFFYPHDKTGLVELSIQERQDIMVGGQGIYAAGLANLSDEAQRTDLLCALDNSRIPTHKRPDAALPATGSVPFDLRQIVEIK